MTANNALNNTSSLMNLVNTTNQLVLGTGNTVTVTSPAPASSRTYTIPDVLSSANFVLTPSANSNGGIYYSTASAASILSGTATANQIILSGSSSTPSWSTATYPSSTTINQLLYSSASNVIGGLATANSSSLVTTSTGVPTWVGAMTNGQLIIGSTGATPVATTLTPGTGISITNGAGSITITNTGASSNWTDVSGTSQAMAVDNRYAANNAGLVTLTLPATANPGDFVEIYGKGAGGWLIAQNAGQTIHLGSSATTAGAGGSLASTNQWDNIYIVCVTANTTWSARAPEGNITVV